jgi:integrating conjugative element membrane protein (TIGR03747 family)
MANNATMPMSVGMKSITWPFRWLFWTFMLTMLSWSLAVGIGLYFHTSVWVGQGTAPFERALDGLFLDAALASDVGPLGDSALKLTVLLSDLAYKVVFVWTGVEEAYFRAQLGYAKDGLDAAFFRSLLSSAEQVEVMMLVTRLYGAKVAMLAGALPLFALAYCVAMVDGLTARYIRKAGGGRESAFIYHRSKWGIVMMSGTVVMGLMLLPLDYSPRWVLPPMALAIGLLARMQWAYYKKYL